MYKWDLSDHELFNMFVVYNDLNNKCGPYTSSNPLQFRDIPWYSAPFFTCWNQTWYAQLNLSHAIPSINMDIFMGNLARQAVALPKRLTPTHLSQTFTTRCHDISAVSAVSDGLSACARRSSCSSSSSAAKRWNSNSWPRWDVPRLPRVKLHGSGSWLKRLWSSPPGNRDSLLWLYPCGCMVRIFYMKANRVWATWYVSIGTKDSKPLPSFDIPKIYATNRLKGKNTLAPDSSNKSISSSPTLDFKNRVPQIHISPMQKCRMSGYPPSLDKPKSLLVTTF